MANKSKLRITHLIDNKEVISYEAVENKAALESYAKTLQSDRKFKLELVEFDGEKEVKAIVLVENEGAKALDKLRDENSLKRKEIEAKDKEIAILKNALDEAKKAKAQAGTNANNKTNNANNAQTNATEAKA